MEEEIATLIAETPEMEQNDYEGARLVLFLLRDGKPFDSEMIVNHLLRKVLVAAIKRHEFRAALREMPRVE